LMPEDTYSRHNELLRYINTVFTLPPLKNVLRRLNLSITGRKSSLQLRLVEQLNMFRAMNDRAGYEQAKNVILDEYSAFAGTRPTWIVNRSPNGPSTVGRPPSSYGPSSYTPASTARTSLSNTSHTIAPTVYKPSPFYALLQSLSNPQTCPARVDSKGSILSTLRLSFSQVERIKNDSSYKIYLVSTLQEDSFKQADVNFPLSMEIRVNQKPVAVNTKGIKNKPGTAKPADLTSFLVLQPDFKNTVEVYYAYTSTRYVMTFYLARKRSVLDIVTRIASGTHLSKQTVIAQIVKSNSSDDEITATSSVMSLRCPLSFARIQVPIRGLRCNHVQCFDASSYIQLQEQAPVWRCPICNQLTQIENIAVDNYVDEILKTTSADTEAVEIDPDGTWRPKGNDAIGIDSEDDDSEDDRPLADRNGHNNSARSRSNTSATTTVAQSNVIDLTLSDDE
ncbi:PINIT domain-containing protein, partial [Lipomyces japonicus]|uniref:PINIT domain-containing protein n=1 Tax=Lipomyces japonicus TaxID=56871 RepID=UPI0034CDED8A